MSSQRSLATFDDWTSGRPIPWLSTNFGTTTLPFQSWRHFKEAFAPELVLRALNESPQPIQTCLDPFAGSGTTPLACQFLGVHPVAIEVNPYLADLTEAKLATYDADSLTADFAGLLGQSANHVDVDDVLGLLPPTFVEPGVNGRWIFDRAVAERIAALRYSIAGLPNEAHRRFFRVLLGATLVPLSRVVVNGKGRRYRRGRLAVDPRLVRGLFSTGVRQAIVDAHRYQDRGCLTYDVVRGDARRELHRLPRPSDIAVFSPPYPNSFDYTDVYNLELWMLGYLGSWDANRRLRVETLSSHVQIGRDFGCAPHGSTTLDLVLERLRHQRQELWDHRIPDMVGGYFHDMAIVLSNLEPALVRGGSAWVVTGDSKYGSTHIPTGTILAELARSSGWTVQLIEPWRSMRASAQQGGQRELTEQLMVLASPSTTLSDLRAP